MGLTPLRALFVYDKILMIFMIYYKSAK
jgi:hypothetical protein